MIYCDGSKKDSHKIGHEDSESRAMPQLLLQEEAGKKKSRKSPPYNEWDLEAMVLGP